MNAATTPILVAQIIQIALGFAVFQASPGRKSNQTFLVLSSTIAVWLGSLYLISITENLATAEFYIRQASAAGAFLLYSFNLLRISIKRPNQSWRELLFGTRYWLGAALGIVLLCQTPFFMADTVFSQAQGAPNLTPVPVYGNGVYLYSIYFAAAGLALLVLYVRDIKNARGRERTELSFILMGTAVILGLTLLALFIRPFVHQSLLNWLAPFRIVLFSLIIAYGITTRRIMEVGVFFRRVISYALLTLYLLTLYGAVWWLVTTALVPFIGSGGTQMAHIVAALVVAFAMAPARGISQRLADRLFVGSRQLDFGATVSKAATILNSVSTLRELMERFGATVTEAMKTDRVVILLPARGGLIQRYPLPENELQRDLLEFDRESPLVQQLEETREPLVLEELRRIRLTPQLRRVAALMEGLQVAIAMPIASREHLAGVMVLGPRLSGRMYGIPEQNALQVLCGQLAVAIENAELFTEVQNAKIYNETLLQNLTTGVIAADAQQQVTVFNHEAELITGLNAADILGQEIDRLPADLCRMLLATLQTGERKEDPEMRVGDGSRPRIVRASSSIFRDEDGATLGALLVLTDISALKQLELQIRRSDRLASLGTLSAGMAHEIKNPLVSIKTFAQLLPERYQDSDFRETFSNLIGHEIDRIDSLVNQLLRFARPAKPLLKPMHVHETLEKSLQLVGHRLYQKDIKLTRAWQAEVDTIRADADQLEQVFLNFFINAMDAMGTGGELAVSTRITRDDHVVSALSRTNGSTQEILRVTIRDSGEGIRPEDIGQVFDPFFTTKDYGTGLGLSVVHGIIQEHGGQIEVESEVKKGTAFHILLPLVRFESEVAAA